MDRDALILSLAPIIKRVVDSYYPDIETRRELEQAGWCGAVDAVNRCENLATLPEFAWQRIKGAIKDYWRDVDHLSRSHRKAVQDGLVDAPIHVREEVIDSAQPAARQSREKRTRRCPHCRKLNDL